MDTYGSRSLAVGGVALYHASEKVIEKARTIAAHTARGAPRTTSSSRPAVLGQGQPDKGDARRRRLAFAAWTAHNLPDGMEPSLEATYVYDPPNFSLAVRRHIAVVEVDTETGDVELVRYVAVDDGGTVINPMIVDGQVHGGIVQGIAQALLEEAVYDEDGNLAHGLAARTTWSRRAAELPSFELDRTVTPSPTNPLGVKGVGETGTIASTAGGRSTPCVDALAPFGVTDIDMPATPERVWRAIQEATRMIPAPFDYEVAESRRARRRAARLARRRQAPRRRPLAAAADEAPPRPAGARWSTSAASPTCATSATPATASPSARSPATTTSRERPRCRGALRDPRRRGGRDRRPAGAPPRHDRRLARPRRPRVGPAGACCSRSTPSSSPAGRAASAGSRRRTSSPASSRRRSARRTCSPRSACRSSATPAGRT